MEDKRCSRALKQDMNAIVWLRRWDSRAFCRKMPALIHSCPTYKELSVWLFAAKATLALGPNITRWWWSNEGMDPYSVYQVCQKNALLQTGAPVCLAYSRTWNSPGWVTLCCWTAGDSRQCEKDFVPSLNCNRTEGIWGAILSLLWESHSSHVSSPTGEAPCLPLVSSRLHTYSDGGSLCNMPAISDVQLPDEHEVNISKLLRQ